MILSQEEQDFVRRHLGDDLGALALRAHRHPEVCLPQLLPYLSALQKIRVKLPSWFRLDLDIPLPLSVEQASSEPTARFKASLFSGCRMADLTGGLGVDAFFWAQSFREVLYVERDPTLAEAARRNFAVLGAHNICVQNALAEHFLLRLTEPLDLVYLDPSRRDEHRRRLFRLEDCSPNVPALRELLLQKAPQVLLKTSPMLDIAQAAKQLKQVERVWVISVGGEVREVLLLLQGLEIPLDEIAVEAVVLTPEQTVTFVFNRAEEQSATPNYSEPQRYLYEPDAALLKAGAFKTFAVRYGLAKLHPLAHLYTAEHLVPCLPARCFTVEAVLKYDRREVHRHLPTRRAHVAVRNFPHTAEEMRKNLGLLEGGDTYLFGTTAPNGQKILLMCRRTPTFM